MLICSYCEKMFRGTPHGDRSFCSEKCHRLWLVELRRLAEAGDKEALEELKRKGKTQSTIAEQGKTSLIKKEAPSADDLPIMSIEFNRNVSEMVEIWNRMALYLGTIAVILVIQFILMIITLGLVIPRMYP